MVFFPGIFMGEDSEEMLRSFDCAPFVPLAQDDIFFGKGVNFGGDPSAALPSYPWLRMTYLSDHNSEYEILNYLGPILRRTFLRRELCGWILMNEGRNPGVWRLRKDERGNDCLVCDTTS